MQKSTGHRVTLGAYIRAGRHMLSENKAKTVRQIAAETGMSIRTARYWLERDHREEWFRWWPSFAAIVADVFEERDLNRAALAASAFLDDLPDLDPADIAAADDMR